MTSTSKRDYFAELSKSLDRIHSTTQAEIYLWQISDKIAWCWQWKKITAEQKDKLCDSMTKMYKTMF